MELSVVAASQRPEALLLDGFTVFRVPGKSVGDDVTVPFPENFRSTLDANVEIRGSSQSS